MGSQTFVMEDAKAYAELPEGGNFLKGFLHSLLDGYRGKTDWRDFDPAERDEIVLNCHRLIEILRDAEGE